MGILQTCRPRADIINGTINLEIFTASLGEVLKFYRGQKTPSSDLYTDAKKFFREGTYATEGIKSVLNNVVARLSGDASAPSFRRLDTAFGGGKTHTLIACVHLAKRGKELAGELREYLSPEMIERLPELSDVTVVGVPCDSLDLYKKVGKDTVPNTLWGEIARQVGGDELYDQLGPVVTSRGAPGEEYFETLFGGKKVLFLFDEIAQYAVRCEQDHAGAAESIAAFLMGLDNYVRNHSGMCTVLTLASSKDAFAGKTALLNERLKNVDGTAVNADDAALLSEKAQMALNSVVARSATNTTPVTANEIASVLACRLFDKVDRNAAVEESKAYGNLYAKNKMFLPEAALKADYGTNIISTYPFHPSFVDFLNQKLALSETFQGTRGVLRMLSLCVKNIWQNQSDISMIHSGDLDLTDMAIADELFGKTNSGALRPILTTDICSGDAKNPSKSEELDQKRPHPMGIPVYRQTWQSVFLNSLTTTDQQSNAFGIRKPEVCLEVLRPGLSAATIEDALKQIDETAMYLRSRDGRYYASTEPSINRALAEIRSRLNADEVERVVRDMAVRVCSKNNDFDVVCNVHTPGEIQDKNTRPVVAFIALDAGTIDPRDFFMYCSSDIGRRNQNNLLLVVPETVKSENDTALLTSTVEGDRTLEQLSDIARTLLARRRLKNECENYNIKREKVEDEEYKRVLSERAHALEIRIAAAYKTLYLPVPGDDCCEREDIATASGESGTAFLEQVKAKLLSRGKYVDESAINRLSGLEKFIFDGKPERMPVEDFRKAFTENRAWPIAKDRNIIETILRTGVSNGNWNIFFLKEGSAFPEKLFTVKKPLSISDTIQDDWDILSNAGLVKRGWDEVQGLDKERAAKIVQDRVKSTTVVAVKTLTDELKNAFPDADNKALNEIKTKTLLNMSSSGELYAYKGQPDQQEKPQDLSRLSELTASNISDQTVIIQKKEAQRRDWLGGKDIELSGGDRFFLSVLFKRLSRLKGVTSTIGEIAFDSVPLKSGGLLSLQMTDLTPESLPSLEELFTSLAGNINFNKNIDFTFTVSKPQDDCALVKEIQNLRKENA